MRTLVKRLHRKIMKHKVIPSQNKQILILSQTRKHNSPKMNFKLIQLNHRIKMRTMSQQMTQMKQNLLDQQLSKN